MKIGQRVKIKSYHDIIKGVFKSRHKNLLFDPDMRNCCGQPGILKQYRNKYNNGIIWLLETNGWWWHEDWLELIDFFNDKDFEI